MSLFLNFLAEDKQLITYRPSLNKATGGLTASILLSQALYWWKKMGRKAFYKFKTPCDHNDYVQGDSWCEEMGFWEMDEQDNLRFKPKWFDKAFSQIGAKVKAEIFNGDPKNYPEKFLLAHTNMSRKTYYIVNEEYLEKRLFGIYVNPNMDLRKSLYGFSIYTETTREEIKKIKKEPSVNPENGKQETFEGVFPLQESKYRIGSFYDMTTAYEELQDYFQQEQKRKEFLNLNRIKEMTKEEFFEFTRAFCLAKFGRDKNFEQIASVHKLVSRMGYWIRSNNGKPPEIYDSKKKSTSSKKIETAELEEEASCEKQFSVFLDKTAALKNSKEYKFLHNAGFSHLYRLYGTICTEVAHYHRSGIKVPKFADFLVFASITQKNCKNKAIQILEYAMGLNAWEKKTNLKDYLTK